MEVTILDGFYFGIGFGFASFAFRNIVSALLLVWIKTLKTKDKKKKK
jgi:hypothetical protein